MTVQNLSALAGVVTSDATAGSTNASVINNHIAAMAPGDVLVWDCPVSPNGAINVTDKLGIRISGAGPMGSRLSPSGNNDGLVVSGSESCVIENIGIAPKSVQTAGTGLIYDVDVASGNRIPVGNIFRNIDIFDRTAQASGWSLGTGRPYKGVHIRGGTGGYNSLFDAVRANGAVSDGWSIGTYNQSSRGSVGVQLKKCMAARSGGNGYAVFAAEALTMEGNTEALQNQGHGLLTYPDNGGFVELLLVGASFDTNVGDGVRIDRGGAGAGGSLKFVDIKDTWFGNNGNPDIVGGSNWNNSSGFYCLAPVDRLFLTRNNAAVNGAHGFVVGGAGGGVLEVTGNRALNNGQSVNTGGFGGEGFWLNNVPTTNVISGNIADGQAYGPYVASQLTGIHHVGGAAGNATGNVSKNPNYAQPAYNWASVNGSNNQ